MRTETTLQLQMIDQGVCLDMLNANMMLIWSSKVRRRRRSM